MARTMQRWHAQCRCRSACGSCACLMPPMGKAAYKDFSSFDGQCFNDIDVGDGSSTVPRKSDGKDDEDVALRIRKANGMFGSLQKCLLKRKDVTSEAKEAYNSLVLSVLLCGSKSWAPTQRLCDKLRGFLVRVAATGEARACLPGLNAKCRCSCRERPSPSPLCGKVCRSCLCWPRRRGPAGI
jgi:hypothetical protein